MGRRQGRFFNSNFDYGRINRDVVQEQEAHGTEVLWWFYTGAAVDDTYDEGARTWRGPVRVPVLSVVPQQGANQPSDSGMYAVDHNTLRMSYRQITDIQDPGFRQDVSTYFQVHYADRFVFRQHVYSIERIRSDGHFDPQTRDIIVEVDGGQLRPDELVNDAAFANYALF